MTTIVNAIRQLELVASLAEQLLRMPGDVTARAVGNDLAWILSARIDEPPNIEQQSMLELALWSRRYSSELGPELLGQLVLGELVTLWIDQGKTREQFVGAMASGWRSIVNARNAIGLGPDSRPAESSRLV